MEPPPLGESAPAFLTPPSRRRTLFEWLAGNYERIVLALLILQYGFVNLIFTTYTQNIVIMKDLSAPLFSLLILGVWISGDLLTTGRWFLPRHGIVPAMVAALVYWGLLVPVAPETSSAVEMWARMCGYFIQVFALIRVVTTQWRWRLVINFVLITNGLLVAYGLSEVFDYDILVTLGVTPDWGFPYRGATYGRDEFLGAALLTTFPVLIAIGIGSRRRLTALLTAALIGCNVALILALHQCETMAVIEMGLPAALIVAAATAWKFRATALSVRRRHAFVIVTIALALVAMSATVFHKDLHAKAWPWFHSHVWSWIVPDADHRQLRFHRFIRTALDGAARSPWLGRGLGDYNWVMPETRHADYFRTDMSHNADLAWSEPVQWLHDTGVIGATLWGWIVIAYLVCALRGGNRTPDSGVVNGWLMLGPAFFWIHGLIYVTSFRTGNCVTFWHVVGLVLAFGRLSSNDEVATSERVQEFNTPRLFRLRAGGVCLATALFASGYALFAYRHWEADHHLRNNMAYTDGNTGSNAQAIREAEEARRLNYMLPSNYYKLAYSYLVGNKLPFAMNAYRDLQSFAPNYAQIHINLAFLNDQLGYRTASAWERDRAAALEHNTRNHRDAANYWLQLGDTSRAIPHLRHCFTIDCDRTEAGYHYWFEVDNIAADLARGYASVGHMDLARDELTHALQLNPNNLSAALLLTELLQRIGRSGDRDTADLRAMLEKHAPDNPAVLVLKMQSALAAKDYATVLELADRASSVLEIPGPGAQPSQDSQMLGNSILLAVQVVFGQNFDRTRCLEIAGWIYAAQTRYGEAAPFLEQAFMANKSPRTAERLGLVKARLSDRKPTW